VGLLTQELTLSSAALHALEGNCASPTKELLSELLAKLDHSISRAADMEMLAVMSRNLIEVGVRQAKYNRLLLVALCGKLCVECPPEQN
jgi:hypothetical protein